MEFINRIRFRTRIILAVAGACFMCAAIAYGISWHFSVRDLHKGIVRNAQSIYSRVMIAMDVIGERGGLDTLIEKYKSKYKSSDELTESERTEILNHIPILSAIKIAQKDAQKHLYSFRVFSDEPRRKENLATTDELRVFQTLEVHPQDEEWI